MFVAQSTFTVENDMIEEVKAAFRLLPELPAELKVDAVATDLRQGVELARKISS